MEDLLNYRVTPRFFYDQYQTISWEALLADQIKPGAIPGLLAIANSYIMPGDNWSNIGSDIVVMRGLGTDSDLGSSDMFYIGQEYVYKLNHYPDPGLFVAAVSASATNFYRDAYDIYINIGSSNAAYSWYRFGGILAENHKDTTIRLGQCAALDDIIDATGIIVDWNKIGDLILDICLAKGYHVAFTDDLNYTYLNVTATEGRGEETGGVYTFTDDDLISIEKAERDEPFSHCLIGTGAASHTYKHDKHTPGIRAKIERIIEFEDEFGDTGGKLSDYVVDEYNDQTEMESWTIEPASGVLFLFPGDWVKLKLDYESEKLLKCVNIDEDCLTGLMTLELSQKKTDISDVFEYLNEAESIFSNMYPMLSAPAVQDSDTEVGFSSGTFSLDIPDGIIDANLKPRIVLTVSINEVYSATTTTDLGDVGKVNLKITIGTYVYYFNGVPIGTMPAIDVTDAVTVDDAALTVSWTLARVGTGTPADAKFTLSASMEFVKRAN